MSRQPRVPEHRIRVGGVLHWSNLARIGVMDVPDRPGVAAEVFAALGERGINVPFIVQSVDLHGHTNIILCVAMADLSLASETLRARQSSLGAAAFTEDPGVALVSVFGPDFRDRPGIAAAVFSALAEADINILAISTSISTVSCLLRQEYLERALQALETAFDMP